MGVASRRPLPTPQPSLTPLTAKTHNSLARVCETTKPENEEDTHSCVLPPSPSPPPPPHLVLCVHGRPRRQKLLHHRRITCLRSAKQRRPTLLRRAAALRQATTLSSAEGPAPPPAPRDLLYHNPRRAAAKNKHEHSSNQMIVPQRVTFWVLEESSILHQYVCGLHLSADASLPPALRCELYEFISKGRIVPGVARSWQHGVKQIGIACFERGS
jgi:hypothetical protein